ncbi:MAG: outer membrane beta-barrel protein [Acidobacteriaceae bacterium]
MSPYLGGKSNQIYGPGYERIDVSIFKNFATWRSQYLEFRTDIFNALNHPTWANPAITNINSNAGVITGPKFFQNNTPDARFFQLSLKYIF